MLDVVYLVPNAVFTVVVLRLVGIWFSAGFKELAKAIATFLLKLPGVPSLVHAFTRREIKGFVKETFNEKNAERQLIPIPKKGVEMELLEKELVELKGSHKNLSEEGKLFAYVYTSSGNHYKLQKQAYRIFNETCSEGSETLHKSDEAGMLYFDAFMHDNALNPVVFPSLRKFENEIVSMTAHMLHGDGDTVGSVTSGGTESILMAVKAYRDRARSIAPHIKQPNIVAPSTLHPAFDKAGSYFDIEIRHVPIDSNSLQAPLRELENAIDENTILLAGSAPAYPHAIMDQIEDMARIAVRHALPFHVDGCYGGFMTPWIEKLGHSIPPWDYRVKGVTSITADLHKYGFCSKGSSVVTYKHESIRKFQFYSFSQWPGGLFASPTMAGTRPGGHLAAAWVTMRSLGQDGYMRVAEEVYETAKKMKSRINKIDGLRVLGNPLITGFAFGSTDKKVSVFQIADEMNAKGWTTEVQLNPDSIHCTILPAHVKSCDNWLKDLADVVQDLKNNPRAQKSGISAMYGMLSVVPDDKIVDDFLVDLFSDIYKS